MHTGRKPTSLQLPLSAALQNLLIIIIQHINEIGIEATHLQTKQEGGYFELKYWFSYITVSYILKCGS